MVYRSKSLSNSMHFKRLKDIIIYDFNRKRQAAARACFCRHTAGKEVSKSYFSDNFSVFKNIDHLVRITLV
jgi:hypothetical protein